MEPNWLTFARRFLGQREVPGKGSNQWIISLWTKLKLKWVFDATGGDDSTAPWCGAFVGSVFADCGLLPAKNAQRALAWLDWGVILGMPTVGAVVVFERKGGGHVGFVVGQDEHDNLMVLGGNQGDSVSIAPFARDRVRGYRWPDGVVIRVARLPIVGSDGKVSHNEA